MTMTRASTLLALTTLLSLGACGRRSGGAPAIEPTTHPVVAMDVPAAADLPTVVDVPVAVDVPAAADVPVVPDEGALNERLLRGLADGSIPLAASVDRALGVVTVSYLEAGPNGGRESHSTQRLCGASTTNAALRQRLQALVTQARELGEGPTCDAESCAARGMEYQPTLRAYFARRPDGSRVLVGAVEVSEALLGEEWIARTQAYVNANLARARSTPCPR